MDTGNSTQAHSHLLNQMTGRVVLQDTGLVHLLTHDGDKKLIDHGHVDRHFGHHFSFQLVADHNKESCVQRARCPSRPDPNPHSPGDWAGCLAAGSLVMKGKRE